MKRKFVKNLLFVVILNLLIKPFWILGIDVAVQNEVGDEQYGLYYHLFSFSILLNIVLDFGITNYNNRNIAQHSHMLSRYFSGIFNVKILLSLIYMAVTFIVALMVGYKGKELWLLFILGINQILSSFILYLRSNISGLHLFKTDGLLSVLDRGLMIILCSILLWSSIAGGNFQIEWFIYAQFWAYFFTAIIAFILVLNKAKHFVIKADFRLFKIILKESLPFALLVLLMSFYYRLDSVMIDLLHVDGEKEVGTYARAYRLLEAFNMLGFLFAGLLLPIFSRMIKKNQLIDKFLNTAFNLLFIPAMALCSISVIHAYDIMDLLYHENINKSSEVFIVLMISFIAIAMTYIYGTLLTANGSLKQLNFIALIGFIINFGLNFWLIPSKGAYGAAIATLITQFFVSVSQVIIVKKLFKIQFPLRLLFRYVLFVLFGIFISYITIDFFENFVMHAIVISIVFGVLALLVGLIQKAQIVALFQKSSD